MDSIYREIILDNYRNPKNNGIINKPSKSISLVNPLCGDKIRIDILLKDDKIEDIKFSGNGCVISQATASMLTEVVKGKTKKELINLDKDFIIKMLGINLSPIRLRCALLPLEALKKMLII